MTLRDDVNVYRVPFTMTVTGFVLVIATSPQEAIKDAKSIDGGNFINVEDVDRITCDGSQVIFHDFENFETVGLAGANDVRVDDDYLVDAHPDYDPSEHDEPDDETPDVEGAIERAKAAHEEGGGV